MTAVAVTSHCKRINKVKTSRKSELMALVYKLHSQTSKLCKN